MTILDSSEGATFSAWTQSRAVQSLGTNSGAPVLAFQEWRHFKEAFTPELVARAIRESPIHVRRCLDPFGGSGTTALACQFLGVEPVTVEVNPYLADLIEAKLVSYDPDALLRDFGRVLRSAVRRRPHAALNLPDGAPPTLVEPGVRGRWVFDSVVAQRLGAMVASISQLEFESHRRFFRVLLGSILIEVSNVVVNGKGRRYRRRWEERRRDATQVETQFSTLVRRAVSDIHRFAHRRRLSFEVVRGDARTMIRPLKQCEVAVFSPPYPNSFDYTDVYNLELWALGYLADGAANKTLRRATLSSHVQIDRHYAPAPEGSECLDKSLKKLRRAKSLLWDHRIPDMVGAYFHDLLKVLNDLHSVLAPKGTAWLVVGDSRYANIPVPTAAILAELAPQAGFRMRSVEPFRSMRSSAQQGGRAELDETLIVLTRSDRRRS